MKLTELASTFHGRAGGFLASLGLEIENDPAETIGPYLATSAQYRARSGFCLWVGFDPLDGGYAAVRCGRKWHYVFDLPPPRQLPEPMRHCKLSNEYSSLAKRFGFEVPRVYRFRSADEAASAIECILSDLEATLAHVLKRVRLSDLEAIEQEEFGCDWLRQKGAGQPGSKVERISTYPEGG